MIVLWSGRGATNHDETGVIKACLLLLGAIMMLYYYK
jgi:hypothetical protein